MNMNANPNANHGQTSSPFAPLPTTTTTTATTTTKPARWASLADRLNPNRPSSFDPQLKASWNNMSKSQRKRIISQDRKAIAALKSRGTLASQTLPFTADPDDHCETSPLAYKHIAPVLKFIASRLNKSPEYLRIYDPYYCAGGMKKHLNELGFGNVYNECEDFYEVLENNKIPEHDVVVTNPPYSGDHFDRLLPFLEKNNKPALLLLPEHFSKKLPNSQHDKFCFLAPPERYHYWTPEGMRPDNDSNKQEKDGSNKEEKKRKKNKQHRNLVLGNRNSPFASHWFICMEPLMTNESFVSACCGVNNGNGNGQNEIQLAEGCQVHRKQESVELTTFKGVTVSKNNNDDDAGGNNNVNRKNNNEEGTDNGRKKKRRRRAKKKTDDAEKKTGESPLELNYSQVS